MSKSTPMYDDDPHLKGGQSRLPDELQKAIIKKKMKAVKDKEKQAAPVIPALIGAASADDPVKGALGGAAGGIAGGYAGGLLGMLAGGGLTAAAIKRNPKLLKALDDNVLVRRRMFESGKKFRARKKKLNDAERRQINNLMLGVGVPGLVGSGVGMAAGAAAGGRAFGGKKKEAAEHMDKTAAHGAEYDDHHMLSKSLERTAAQAMHLKHKLDCGLVLPSWAEYKIYKAYDSVNSALGASYPGHYPMGMKEPMMEKEPSPMIVKAAAHCRTKDKKKKKKKSMEKEAGAMGLARSLNRKALGEAEDKMVEAARQRLRESLQKRTKPSLGSLVKQKNASAEQEIMAALTAEGGAAGMGAIKKRVSSPDLAAAVKRLMAQGKIHKHRDGDIIKK